MLIATTHSLEEAQYHEQDQLCGTVFLLLYADHRWFGTVSRDNWKPICSTSNGEQKEHSPPPGTVVAFLWLWRQIQNCRLTYLRAELIFYTCYFGAFQFTAAVWKLTCIVWIVDNRQSVDWRFQWEFCGGLEDDTQLQTTPLWKEWSTQQHTSRVCPCRLSDMSVPCVEYITGTL